MVIRGVLLDFDGVLVESERQNGELARAFFRERFGVDLTEEDERRVYGYSWTDTFAVLFQRYRIPLTAAEVWPAFFATKRAFLATHPPRAASGVADLCALPVAKAVVSGSEREEILLMAELAGLPPDLLRLLVSNGDVSRPKPDPEGYLRACDLLHVHPSEAVVFEDSRPGIAAARAAGIPVAFVAEVAVEDNAGLADRSFVTLGDAVPWIRERLVP